MTLSIETIWLSGLCDIHGVVCDCLVCSSSIWIGNCVIVRYMLHCLVGDYFGHLIQGLVYGFSSYIALSHSSYDV